MWVDCRCRYCERWKRVSNLCWHCSYSPGRPRRANITIHTPATRSGSIPITRSNPADEPDLATRLAHARLIRLTWGSGYPAFRSDLTTPAARAVVATAGEAAGYPVAVLPMMGASVPIYLFVDIFKVPVIGLP